MKIEVAKMHEVAVCEAVGAANKAIINAQMAGCVVEIRTIEHVTMRNGQTELFSAAVKVRPEDIEA